MSWDVFIMRFPAEARDVTDIPDDWKPPSLGTGREVRAVLTRILPGIAMSDDGWGDYAGPGFFLSTHVDEADDAPVATVALFIRGDSSEAAHTAVAITNAFQARAYDTGSGGFLTADSAETGFDAWRDYRDQVRNQHE
ncbi:MAG: hypothetical protein ACRD0P_14795 [Stackebrandtia sp.]